MTRPLPASKRPLRVIGWREWVSLPDFSIAHIKAKIDTGARTSAIHAFGLEPYRERGARWVRFEVCPYQRDDRRRILVDAPVVDERGVRNSGGKVERRLVVVTCVELFDERFDIELTLARRDEMGFRMLLGRQAVRRRFLVDPGRSYRAGSP